LVSKGLKSIVMWMALALAPLASVVAVVAIALAVLWLRMALADHNVAPRTRGPGTRAVEQILMKQSPDLTDMRCARWVGPRPWNYACDFRDQGGESWGLRLQVDQSGRILLEEGPL
jgi:hypothetical protein